MLFSKYVDRIADQQNETIYNSSLDISEGHHQPLPRQVCYTLNMSVVGEEGYVHAPVNRSGTKSWALSFKITLAGSIWRFYRLTD